MAEHYIREFFMLDASDQICQPGEETNKIWPEVTRICCD